MFLIALALLCVLALAIDPLRTRLAIHDLETGEAPERVAAARLLGDLGHRAAVPALVRALADDDAAVRKAATDSLLAIEEDQLAPIAERLRELAAKKKADPAILAETLAVVEFSPLPLLESLLSKFPEVNARVVRNRLPRAVAQCGEVVVPRLTELLSSDSRDVRENAVRSLGALGARAAPAVPDIVALLRRDGDELTRGYAARALARIGLAAWPAAAELATLAEEDPSLDRPVDTILGGVGPVALPLLLSWLREEHTGRKLRAARLIIQLGRRAEAAVPELSSLLYSEDPEIVQAACRALGAIGDRPATEAAVPDLARLLHSEDRQVVQTACRALGALGPRAVGALSALLSLLETGDETAAPSPSEEEASVEPAAEPFPLLFPEPVVIDPLRFLPGEMTRAAAADAVVAIDAKGEVPFELVFPHVRGRPSRGSGENRWSWLERYSDFVPAPRELAAALRDPQRRALARAVLERRSALAADPAVRDALGWIRRTSRHWELPARLGPADRRAMITQVLLEWHKGLAEGWPRDGLFFDRGYEDNLVSILTRLEAFEELEKVYPALTKLHPRVEAVRCLHAGGRTRPGHVDVMVKGLEAPVTRTNVFHHGRGEIFSPSFHCNVADLLGEMGPLARAAVPALRRRSVDLDPQIRLHATIALRAIDGERWVEPAVTALRSCLRARSSEDWGPFDEFTERIPVGSALRALGHRSVSRLLPLLDDSDALTRRNCLEALGEAGEIAVAARTRVIERLADPDFRVRDAAMRALAELGAGGEEVSVLLDLLAHGDAEVRADVVEALGSLRGEFARQAVERISARLEKSAGETDADAAAAASLLDGLAMLAPHADLPAVDRVVGRLGDPREAVGEAAVGTAVAAGERAVAPLLRAATFEKPDLRRRAIVALGRLGRDAAHAQDEIRRTLEKALEDPAARVRIAAARALPVLGLTSRGIPVLVTAIRSAGGAVMTEAVQATAALGASVGLPADGRGRILAALDQRLGHESAAVEARTKTLRAIAAIAREGPPPHLPAVFAALEAPETQVRLEAVRTFAAAGTRDRQVALRLLDILSSDREIEVRRAAARAVGRGASDAAALAIGPLLQRIEKDTDSVVRENAARSLGRIGESGSEFADDDAVRLAGALKDSHVRVKKAAAEALRELGSQAEPAVPAMLDYLAERRNPAAHVIIRALVALGPSVVDQLIAALDRENVSLRSAVLDILGEIGPPARKALPRMRWFLDHGNTRYGGLEEAIRRVEGN